MDHNVTVGQGGELRLSEQQQRRWGLAPGAEVLVEETPEGLLLRPSAPPLTKVYVEPTTACNLNCPMWSAYNSRIQCCWLKFKR